MSKSNIKPTTVLSVSLILIKIQLSTNNTERTQHNYLFYINATLDLEITFSNEMFWHDFGHGTTHEAEHKILQQLGTLQNYIQGTSEVHIDQKLTQLCLRFLVLKFRTLGICMRFLENKDYDDIHFN